MYVYAHIHLIYMYTSYHIPWFVGSHPHCVFFFFQASISWTPPEVWQAASSSEGGPWGSTKNPGERWDLLGNFQGNVLGFEWEFHGIQWDLI